MSRGKAIVFFVVAPACASFGTALIVGLIMVIVLWLMYTFAWLYFELHGGELPAFDPSVEARLLTRAFWIAWPIAFIWWVRKMYRERRTT
jgi:heme/copper-type cytochrome/quinol oxidase subunit 2